MSTKAGKTSLTYSAKELVQIIKTCGQVGVTNLEIGDIKIAFIDNNSNITQNHNSDHTVQVVQEFRDVEHAPSISPEDEMEMLRLTDSHKWEQGLRAEETEEAYHVGASPAL